jgi:hypothetical protein
MDEDLETMSANDLIAEVKKLRAGIRKHRDSTGHELCWHHPDLWALLPDRTDPVPTVPAWPVFLRACATASHSTRSCPTRHVRISRIRTASLAGALAKAG